MSKKLYLGVLTTLVLSLTASIAHAQTLNADLPREQIPEQATTFEVTPEQAEAECAPYPTVPIHVTPVFDDPSYDYTVDIGGLQKLAQDTSRTVHSGHRGLTLGLTRYEPILEFRTPVRQVNFPDGLTCAHVEYVDVNIGYRNVTVLIPHEVPQGSCGFGEVMKHEQKHIAVNRAILDEYAPLIAERLQAYLRLNGVFRQPNPEYAVSLLRQKLMAILNDLSSQIATENHRRQELVDSPQEYARVSNTCNGQLIEAAQKFYQGK